MSAIYQRARPVRWEDILGQEHVKGVLKAALEQEKVGHAYLFSGPRGVGKTTTARLIAMTANCRSDGTKPCGECDSCLSIRAGSHPDVLEIDAASNNRVEDVRELREKVNLSAMYGGKKIYILDEAHMMSKSAFNALLKTLEEPPSHVIFILATTEPEKIIPTILSRCQHYRFRRLTPSEIASKLSMLTEKEGASAEPAALQLMGKLADGAMRDGESLLERMLAESQQITLASVEEALGLPPNERVRSIAQALVQNQPAEAFGEASRLYRDGFAARSIVDGLLTSFSEALHAELGLIVEEQTQYKLSNATVPLLLRLQASLDEQEVRFARSSDGQSLELALTHALLAGFAGAGSAQPAATAQSATVSHAVLQRLSNLEREVSTLKSRPPTDSIPEFRPQQRGSPPTSKQLTGTQPASSSSISAQPVNASHSHMTSEQKWRKVIERATINMRALLRPSEPELQQGCLQLTFGEGFAFHVKGLLRYTKDLADIILQIYGPIELEIIGPDDIYKKIKIGDNNSSTTATSLPVAKPPSAPPANNSGNSARGPQFEPLKLSPKPDQPRQQISQKSTPAPTRSRPVDEAIPIEAYDDIDTNTDWDMLESVDFDPNLVDSLEAPAFVAEIPVAPTSAPLARFSADASELPAPTKPAPTKPAPAKSASAKRAPAKSARTVSLDEIMSHPGLSVIKEHFNGVVRGGGIKSLLSDEQESDGASSGSTDNGLAENGMSGAKSDTHELE